VRTGLRALIDEMMLQLRAAAAHDSWSLEERARAEADLARIMAQVRDRAISGRNEDVQRRAGAPGRVSGRGGGPSERDRLLDAVEAEFDVRIPAADRAGLETVGQLVSYVAVRHPPPGESLTAEELRHHVAAVVGELLAREHGRSFAGYGDDAPLPGGGPPGG
jgi:hypothetical protein